MAAADRPLLVLHDKEEGHLVYDLLLLDGDGEEAETLACFPRPVARFPSQWCLSFAVSGGSVVGAEYDFHDTVMKVGGYDFWERQDSSRQLRDSEGRLVRWWPMCRRYAPLRSIGGRHRDRPAMLPLADGTVVRMDTVLFDGIYTFETLRLLPDGGGWHATPLPNPPVGPLREDEIAFVSAYLAVGTRVWISVTTKGTLSASDMTGDDVWFSWTTKGTFSLDTETRAWRKEGTWLLPFEGRALHVPELDSVVGLTAGTRLLCACDVANLQVLRHVWADTYPRPSSWEECIVTSDGSRSKPRDMPSLAYLGKGRICICRPMSTMEPRNYGPVITYNAASFLVVELEKNAGNGGDLHLARRGKMTYMWPPQGREAPYMGLIQPAT